MPQFESDRDIVPLTPADPGAGRFWLSVALTGVGAGCAAAALTLLLHLVQFLAWGPGDLLDAAARADAWRRILVLLGAGLVTGAGQLILVRLSSASSIETTEAIWFSAGRLPALRTVGSAVLSVIVVGLGASLGREGAPKEAGAVIANVLADRGRLGDEQRRLLVACGAGAGMAAAYGVPLGGALFALEVLRGALSLRLVLPAMVMSLIATAVAWLALPNVPTYPIPAFATSASIMVWSVVAGPIAGVVSVLFVRAIAWADHNRPRGWPRLAAPILVLGLLGVVAIPFPQLLGNGQDVAWLAFAGSLAPPLLAALVLLKPLATTACLASGAPGGLFTPSLTLGALLGGLLGWAWTQLWPGTPAGAFAVVGAAAMLAATTQGPLSAVVLMMELTGLDRPLIVPILLAVAAATLTARAIEPRSIYEARLTDAEVEARIRAREPRSSHAPPDAGRLESAGDQ